MAKPKGGLGRGLDSLFEDTRVDKPNETSTLSIREIEPDREQPRKVFDEQALNDLAESIRQHGLLQPITVRPADGGMGYRIVAGERRWRAARLAGLTEVPVIIREISDEQAMELALIENLQREDLNPVEQAKGIQSLMEACGLTQEAAAEKLGKSRSAVANSLRLLGLPDRALQALSQGAITQGHAKVILGLPTQALMEEAVRRIEQESLNVRQTEALCKQLVKAPKPAAVPRRKPVLATEVELALRETTGNEVKVDLKKGGKGTLTLHFYSEQQLKAFALLLGQYNPEIPADETV